jgi:menaquinone-dependent protoporphyrinogen oxidase
MKVLVAYASRYGATRAIAERIAEKLTEAGHEAQARPVKAVTDLAGYQAFVIGSAVYFGKWLKDGTEFVRRNHAGLAADRPVWLFSSGPLGTETTDADGRDVRAVAEPAEVAEFRESIHPGDHRVFFGALTPGKLGFRDRMIKALPAGRTLLPEGDFRAWTEIDAWANQIAHELARTSIHRHTGKRMD